MFFYETHKIKIQFIYFNLNPLLKLQSLGIKKKNKKKKRTTYTQVLIRNMDGKIYVAQYIIKMY